MNKLELEGKGIRLVLQENILAVFSDSPLQTVSSAFHNGGGIKPSNIILNIEVPKGYGDIKLHMDPEGLIADSARKLGVQGEFVAMITAARVKNFAVASKRVGEIGVSVIATAADDEGNTCDHAESSGEEIKAYIVERGTINVIVVMDGNPTPPALISSVVTATEAKTAALLELDIRSAYSGVAATGTITDAMVCAKTGAGEPILFGGPASELGQLVGFCTKKAVREAITKGRECSPLRPLLDRLSARHLSVEKLALELAKLKILGKNENDLEQLLLSMIKDDPLVATLILAAVKLDEDMENGLLPPELGRVGEMAKTFAKRATRYDFQEIAVSGENLDKIDLPLFLRNVLVGLLRKTDATNLN
jgi:adenosylcobinamide hydrolase